MQQYTVYRLTEKFVTMVADGDQSARDLMAARMMAFDSKSTDAIKANQQLIEDGHLVPAATLLCDQGDLFDVTNSINSNWFEAEGIVLLSSDRNPRMSSSSMGDVYADEDGQLYMYTMSSAVKI